MGQSWNFPNKIVQLWLALEVKTQLCQSACSVGRAIPVRKFMAWHKRNSSQTNVPLNRENWARKTSAKIRLTRAGKINENGTRHLYRRDIGAPLWAVIWRDSGPMHGRKNPAGERDDNSGFNGSSSSISLYILTSTTNNNLLGLFCNLCTQ